MASPTQHERLDLVILGATGYTGRLAVRQMLQYPGVRWGIAGRDWDRLQGVLREARENGVDTSNVAVLLADVDDAGSLSRLCRSSELVVNCCGPYARYGERVVAAAVAEGCHHVDVSAENHFTLLLEREYEAAAQKAGVCVITSCGLSSVPVDMGVSFLEKNFGGTLDRVDSYLTTHPTASSVLSSWRHGVIRYSSWESMIHGMAQKKDPGENDTLQQNRPLLHRRLSRWCVPYPISDAFIVARSQHRLKTVYGKHPVRCNPYLVILNFFVAVAMLMFFLWVKVLAKMSWTRKMLLNYPRLCSFGMVSYDRDLGWMNEEQPYEYVLIGSGWAKGDDITCAPNQNIIANITVRGADPAYAGTVTALMACAVTLRHERDNMPAEGGVMTPGYAFYNTDLMRRLEETGTYTFQIKHT